VCSGVCVRHVMLVGTPVTTYCLTSSNLHSTSSLLSQSSRQQIKIIERIVKYQLISKTIRFDSKRNAGRFLDNCCDFTYSCYGLSQPVSTLERNATTTHWCMAVDTIDMGVTQLGLPDLPYFPGAPVFRPLSPVSSVMEAEDQAKQFH